MTAYVKLREIDAMREVYAMLDAIAVHRDAGRKRILSAIVFQLADALLSAGWTPGDDP